MKVFTALVFLAVLGLALAATAIVSKDKEVNGTVPSGPMPVPPQHARDARYYGYYGGYYPSYGYYWG